MSYIEDTISLLQLTKLKSYNYSDVLEGFYRIAKYNKCLHCGKKSDQLYFYFHIKFNIICRYACEECIQKARNKAKVIEEL